VEIGEGGKWFVMLANWCISAVGLNCIFVLTLNLKYNLYKYCFSFLASYGILNP
jgi:hypothetical protein